MCPPGSSKTWAHPKLCELYYQCENEKPTIKECDNGLHYNPAIGSCDLKEVVKCNITCICCTNPHYAKLSVLDQFKEAFGFGSVPSDKCE
ncbi:carbohydrate-binding module family 14 protein, partial [Vibrio alginolyticus]|uniref:carbohydrate-binding module family 14 protein n=1 Tax=Vibrio alginolyticus TaxID=663 RepID=UPI0038CD5440